MILDYDIPIEQKTEKDYASYSDMQNTLGAMLLQNPQSQQEGQVTLEPLINRSLAGK